MIRALLVTAFPGPHVETVVVPELRRLRIDVTKIVKAGFNGDVSGVRAMLVIEQGTSEAERTALRKRAHHGGASFILLSQQRSRWPLALRDLATAEPEAPAPVVAPAPPPVPAAPERITFGAWLRARREADGSTQETLGGVLGCSGPHVAHMEAGDRVAPDLFTKITALYGELPPHVIPPQATIRAYTGGGGRRPAVPAPVEIPLPKLNGHHAAPSSLAGLRAAARALRLGEVKATCGDTTVVAVGGEQWSGDDPDAVVAQACEALRARARQAIAELQAAFGGAV
jgi:hypothetical protein